MKQKKKVPAYLRDIMDKAELDTKHSAHLPYKDLELEQNTAIAVKHLSQKVDDTITIESQLVAADEFVNKHYLSNLGNAEVVEFGESLYSGLAGMRWYRLTRLIYEQKVFFPNLLATVYAALHGEARQLALVIQKRNGNISLYIGVRDKDCRGEFRSGKLLENSFRGVFPGISIEEGMPDTISNDTEFAISSVSGVASLRDNKKETFIQGLERVINSTTNINNFTAYFIADSISDEEATNVVSGYKALYTNLTPISKRQVTYSKALTQSESETVNKGFSKTLNTTIGRTITNGTSTTHTTNTTDGSNTTKGKFSGHSVGFNITYGIGANYGYNLGKNSAEGTNHSEGTSDGTSKNTQESDTNNEQRGETSTESKANQIAKSIAETSSAQVTIEDKHISTILKVLDKQISRLEESAPYGLWNCCAYFIAETRTTSGSLANLYKGVLVGEESGLQTMAVNTWSKEGKNAPQKMLPYIKQALNPLFSYRGFNVTAGSIVNSKELAIHMSLPQSNIPGLLVRNEVAYGRSVLTSENLDEFNSLEIGCISHLGYKDEKEKVRLSLNELSKHAFVTGTTGSGKSNTMYLIIDELLRLGKKIMIIEPAKGEYKNIYGSRSDVNVFGTNPKISQMLRINPFTFPDNVHVYEHIDQLVEIFNACWPMYAAMPQVLHHSIEMAYKNCGWDLRRSENKYGLFPTIQDVLIELKAYINSSEYSNDTKSDYKGALETRLQSLCEGITGLIFMDEPIDESELFDGNSIVDLSLAKSSETKSLIMGLLIMKLEEYRMSQHKEMNEDVKHVTIIEEAHNLLKKTSTQQTAEGSNLAGMAVERIANSMAEMRTYGEGFIIVDQSPSMLDAAAIRNTNTKIIMALPEVADRETAGQSIGLDKEQIDEISRLGVGKAIVYQNNWEVAVKAQITDAKKFGTWRNQPHSYAKEDLNTLFEQLYEIYAISSQLVEKTDLIDSIKGSTIPATKKYALLELIKSSQEELNPNFAALAIKEIVGTDLWIKTKDNQDLQKQEQEISLGIRQTFGINVYNCDTFAQMYMMGCSLSAENHFHEEWQLELTKQSMER